MWHAIALPRLDQEFTMMPNLTRNHLAVGAFIALATWSPASSFAQSWVAFDPAPKLALAGARVIVNWDPDGSGPLPTRTVVGGTFNRAGRYFLQNVAVYDAETGEFTPLGRGLAGAVSALAVLPSGELVAGGDFTSTGAGVSASGVARWTGSEWAPIGSGLTSTSVFNVLALRVTPTGELLAGGGFTSSGGAPVKRVARWTGTAWQQIGLGFDDGRANDLLVLPDSTIVGGGTFQNSGGVESRSVARWNGTEWEELTGLPPGTVFSLAVLPNGRLVAGGDFIWVSSQRGGVAQWNGTAWVGFAGGDLFQGYANRVLVRSNGQLIVAGNFSSIGGVAANGVGTWDGSAWSQTGVRFGPTAIVDALGELPDGRLISGGFTLELSALQSGVWGTAGSAPLNGPVWALANLSDGRLLAGGSFTTGRARTLNGVGVWNGSAWASLGSGMNGLVRAVAQAPNGDYLAGGDFTTAGGVAASRIARWNGSAWQPLGAGVDGAVRSILALGNGDVYVAGDFASAGGLAAGGIARWDGQAWQPVGTGTNGQVYALAQTASGDVAAGGAFSTAGGVLASNVAVWNGTAWSSLGTGISAPVNALMVRANGRLAAGGNIPSGGGSTSGVYREWNGSAWVVPDGGAEPNGFTRAYGPIVSLARGASTEFAASSASFFSAGPILSPAARWTLSGLDGPGWTPLNSSSSFAGSISGSARVALVRPSGDLLIGGEVSSQSGQLAQPRFAESFIARYGTAVVPCSADCDNSGGLSPSDFSCFLQRYRASEVAADVNGDGGLSPSDFSQFLALYRAGCSF